MILALLGAVAAAATVAVTFRVPLPAAGIVLLDVASIGALAGALIALTIAKLRRKPLPLRTLGVATTAALAGFAHLRFAPAAPAVIVMVVDCLRADRFADGKMPKVYNRLRDGVRFTRARSQSSWTRSAMPSLLSGRYPIEHGLFRTKPPDRIRSEVTMLAERFSDAGWLTGAFAEQAQLDPAFGYGRGFDRYGWHDGLAPSVNTKWLRWNSLFRTVPRFVLVHYIDVHGPYTPSKRFRPKNLPKANVALAPSAKWRTTIRKFRAGELALTTDDWARMRGLYDGEVRQIDTRIDAALGKLERDGTLDNAWFVFTADHGERFGEHDEIEHMGPPDETVISVPLLVRPPGGVAARTVHDVVQHVDVVPTLLAAVGLPADPDLPGRDLAPALRGDPLPAAPSFAEEWWGSAHRASVREGDWKLLHDGTAKVYDLSRDPLETTDLAAANPAILARLQGQIAAYFAAGNAGTPIADVDWAAAAVSGKTWTPSARTNVEAAEPSDGTMEALEALGYLDEEE